MARMKGRDYNMLSTPMFITKDLTSYQPEWEKFDSITECGNTFTAANKPTTFKHYDETGLLGVCCR